MDRESRGQCEYKELLAEVRRWMAYVLACAYSCCLVEESFMSLAIRSMSLSSALSWSYIGLKRQYAQTQTLVAPTPPAIRRLRRC